MAYRVVLEPERGAFTEVRLTQGLAGERIAPAPGLAGSGDHRRYACLDSEAPYGALGRVDAMRKRDLGNKEAIQAAVRQVAEQYLQDPNINSVGVGYKVKDGVRTDELALQFTVGQTIGPETLEAAPTRPIPETITANGITFVTDVVEREFRAHPVAVAPEVKPDRKRRLDPLLPGISIGHVRTTAGTLGCLVRENGSGETRILSNWHVLQGDSGKLGDPIVQPGPFDDNRIADNPCGTLIRSFLGLAGDCAIASITSRGAAEEILDLGVAVREIGDPE